MRVDSKWGQKKAYSVVFPCDLTLHCWTDALKVGLPWDCSLAMSRENALWPPVMTLWLPCKDFAMSGVVCVNFESHVGLPVDFSDLMSHAVGTLPTLLSVHPWCWWQRQAAQKLLLNCVAKFHDPNQCKLYQWGSCSAARPDEHGITNDGTSS